MTIKNANFDEAVNLVGYGKFDALLILSSGICIFGIYVDLYVTGYILPSAECELNLTTFLKGVISSSNFIGIMVSSLLWGYLTDTKGRKKVIVSCLIMASLTSIAASLQKSFWGFAALRILNGIFLSGPISQIFVYVGEFQSKTNRSKSIAWVSLFISFALLYLPGMAWYLLSQDIEINLFLGLRFTNWRLFMFHGGCLHFLSVFLLLQLPESPRYLYHSGYYKKALDVLIKMYKLNTGNPKTFPIESLQEKIVLDRSNKNIFKVIGSQIKPLFLRSHFKYTLTACYIQGANIAMSSGLFLWYPNIVNELSKSANASSGITICEALSNFDQKNEENGECVVVLDTDIFTQNMILAGFYFVGYITWNLIVNKTGNRNFFVIIMAISSATTIAFVFIPQRLLINIFFMISLMLAGLGVAVINLAIVDNIPTNSCGMAVSVTMTVGRCGSIIAGLVTGIMLQWNCVVTFLLYAVSLIISLGLAFIFPNKPKT